jgi:antitoxin component YwqK of YwqJK toxin-antitoxin module
LLQQKIPAQSDTSWLTFRIQKAYKNCKAGQLVQIQANAYTTALLKRKSCHLVYAEATLAETLYCPKLEALKAANTRRQLKVLEQLIQHSSVEEFVEYSPYGKVWAKGRYQEGVPYGIWQYFAYSGELKITAQYVRGLKASQWRSYAHTGDEEYKILQDIITWVYARQWDDYAVLGIDTNTTTKFRYTLRYLVNGDTMVERFYYNKPHLTQYRFYREGKKHGLENSFREDGTSFRTYTFQDGRLHGVYRELLPWAQEQGAYVEVKGQYIADRREEEIHYYYNAQGHFLYKKVIVKAGKVL